MKNTFQNAVNFIKQKDSRAGSDAWCSTTDSLAKAFVEYANLIDSNSNDDIDKSKNINNDNNLFLIGG